MKKTDLPKNLDLVEVTLNELGGQQPTAGTVLVLGQVRYLVVSAKPPKAHSLRWKRSGQTRNPATWKLLVQLVTE
ncbi:MAG: hypothetical protein L0Z62_23850 [Gemmataceae bacterium]|nr:hypothetical protein [Gemmataceae bacterium]